jgi:hypothetical protein
MSMHSINRYNTSINGAITNNSATFSVNSETCDDPQFDDNFVQIHLDEVINNHKASLKMHDDIIDIFNDYISAPDFDRYWRLSNRKLFMQGIDSTFQLTHLHPRYCDVQLHNKSVAMVPVFDAKAMILDLLTNPMCMQKNNLADGYDIFTGLVNEQLPAN